MPSHSFLCSLRRPTLVILPPGHQRPRHVIRLNLKEARSGFHLTIINFQSRLFFLLIRSGLLLYMVLNTTAAPGTSSSASQRSARKGGLSFSLTLSLSFSHNVYFSCHFFLCIFPLLQNWIPFLYTILCPVHIFALFHWQKITVLYLPSCRRRAIKAYTLFS